MKKTITIFIFLFISIIFVAFTNSCSGSKSSTAAPSSSAKPGKSIGEIPPDFPDFKDTLLAISHGEDWGYNKFLKKNFKENYSGKYKIIYAKDLDKYPPETYRFVFDNSQNYTRKVNTATGMSSTYASSDRFFVTDRVTQKSYGTKSSSMYSKLMRAYIKQLEEVRKK